MNNSPDIVFIIWERNSSNSRAPRRIVQATVIGSANPCRNLLDRNDRFSRAQRCLLENGFEREFQEVFGTFGVSVFVRSS
ncbi:hypothetical protein [Neobacillus bataviensis]|uniref:hypothetical protein n=1 Tax=Neobacillus bataviensis TaxID=220685 RepID=UPI001CC1BFC1|nr:hypothetical protein [Neobacillus bataviensis]